MTEYHRILYADLERFEAEGWAPVERDGYPVVESISDAVLVALVVRDVE